MNRNATEQPDGTATATGAGSAETIVVGLDGSRSAAAALQWASEQSIVSGVPLRVVHAWQMRAIEVAAASAEFWETAQADARAQATRWVLDSLGEGSAEVRWSLEIAEGPPGPVLVARSRGARLLVLGTRESTGLKRAVLGSVSHYCLSHAEVPVVAVPTPQVLRMPGWVAVPA